MKKIFGVIILGLIAIGFSACSMNSNDVTKLSSEESLSSMAYISANLLDLNSVHKTTSLMLSDTDPLEIEEEIDEVNDYLVILKSFMENGSTNFGNIEVVESDKVLYENLINITVSGEVYSLYYNVDSVSDEVSGIFLIDDVEYEITAYNDLEDKDAFEADDDDDEEEDFDNENDDEEEFDDDNDDEEEFDDDNDDEEEFDDDNDDEEFDDDNEEKMTLIARNGEDYIEMTYKVETEEDEVESKFQMKSSINNEIKEVTIKIENEEDEYKVEIEDGNNYYEFKREIESDEIEYKLEYKVNEVEGEIKITETQDDLGNSVYQYEIEEEGQSKEIEVDEDDDDNDENEIEEDEAI